MAWNSFVAATAKMLASGEAVTITVGSGCVVRAPCAS
jgi:hypothetical protein